MLDISADNAGILIPRMTKSQKLLISSPAVGLMIYQTDDTTGFWYFNGNAWLQSIGTTGVTGPTGADGATGFLAAGSAAGNTPYWDGNQWVINSSNIFNNGGSVGIGTNSPDASAALDITSNNAGLLIPRLTATERNAINNPTEGLQIFNTDTKCIEFFADGEWLKVNCAYKFNCGYDYVTFSYNGALITYGTVKGQNNTCWLDRNLGASTVASSYNHVDGYGDLFQWGRLADGHQLRTSGNTSILSNSNIPGHSNFITSPIFPYDWRFNQNHNFWQGVSSINNPCPDGWRLPSVMEYENERISWTLGNNYTGAINSPLKLPAAGYRMYNSGSLYWVGSSGFYWTSSISATEATRFDFNSTNAVFLNSCRADAMSVRCIKD